jgi:hypothetical protein
VFNLGFTCGSQSGKCCLGVMGLVAVERVNLGGVVVLSLAQFGFIWTLRD